MADKKLSAEDLDQFIDLYYDNKCLWDVRCKEYRDLSARNKAYATIAAILNVTVEFVKKKINNLRSTYNQEKKKIAASQITGTGTEDVYQPSLPWFSKMTFLDEVMIPRRTIGSYENNHTISQVPDNNRKEKEPNTDENQHSKFTKKRRLANDSADFDAALKTFREVCAAESSEFDKFGDSVASQLKALPLKNALQLQLEIQQLITNKRLQLLDNEDSRSLRPLECETRPSTSSSSAATAEYRNLSDIEYIEEENYDSDNTIFVAMRGANIL